MSLNVRSIKALTAMSWFEDRRIDPSIWIDYLEKEEGYVVFEAAANFLRRFGGLEGTMPPSLSPVEKVHFNPIKAAETIYRDKVVAYEQRVKERLVIVGESNNSHLTLMISESGRLFAGYDDYLFLLGDDELEGLNKLFSGAKFAQVGL
jgi:hypothetical protein